MVEILSAKDKQAAKSRVKQKNATIDLLNKESKLTTTSQETAERSSPKFNKTKVTQLVRKDLITHKKAFEKNRFVVTKKPFKVSLVENLLIDKDFVAALRKNILDNIDLNEKNNDLYTFKQSKDIITEVKRGKTQTIQKFIQIIRQYVAPAISKDTGLDLDAKHIDMTVSRYDCGDHLLCHNDDIERVGRRGRLVAFVYYLVDQDWSHEDGGSLQLFSSVTRDERSWPEKVRKLLYPKANSLVYFKTSDYSWHAVEEVLRPEGCRLSINGWFHGSKKPSNKIITSETNPMSLFHPIELPDSFGDLSLWIEREYLYEKTWIKVNENFSETSEINLSNFLTKDKYSALNLALTESVCNDTNKIKRNIWNFVGPLNIRNYRRADLESLPKICQDLVMLFRSEPFFLLLSKLTGLDLEYFKTGDKTKSFEKSNTKDVPKVRAEFRSWEGGYYTLIHDHSYEHEDRSVLDLTLRFNTHIPPEESGGSLIYIAKDEDETLLTVEPTMNSLSLVYRDSETARFVKYMSKKCLENFQDLSCVYYPRELPHDSSSSNNDSEDLEE